MNHIEKSIQNIINHYAVDPGRPGFSKTPERVRKAFDELTSGYRDEQDIIQNCKNAIFKENVRSVVSVKEIEFYSLCEHHLLPFWGTVSISFMPHQSGKILGLSKFARIVDVYSKRFQVQERLVQDITTAITKILEPRALIVTITAQHMCMMMRGIGKQYSSTKTTLFSGSETYKSDLEIALQNEH